MENQNSVLITKDMLINQIIQIKPQSLQILMQHGMGCIGCPASLMESLEQAAMVHGIDPDQLLEKLNAI